MPGVRHGPNQTWVRSRNLTDYEKSGLNLALGEQIEQPARTAIHSARVLRFQFRRALDVYRRFDAVMFLDVEAQSNR